MAYTSFVFIIFLAISCIVYYIVPKKAQWVVLLIASLTFYILSSKAVALIMIVQTLSIYLGARLIQKQTDSFKAKKGELDKSERKLLKASVKRKQKGILTSIVIFNVAVLAVLKYCNFFGGIVNDISSAIANKAVMPVFSLVLPLGISYYTLMSISYIVDVYRGKISAEKNPFRLLLFVCYFPHIIEGPFDRYDDLNSQFNEPHYLDYDVIKNGVLLMLWGFFKKLVIADRAGFIASGIFDNYESLSGTSVMLAVLMYTLQLYADFSGCIEIVSGASEIFGIKIADNFKQPFFSRSINEFWRRWHITLGLWLKEYVFYPVSLSSNFKKVNAFVSKHIKNDYFVKMIPAAYALFFVWFCNGIWHGASGKYIFYGLYYYILMMLGEFSKPLTDKLIAKCKINVDSKLYHFWQMLRTFIIVNIGMLIFRSATIKESTILFFKQFKSVNFIELFNHTFKIENISNKDYILLIVCVIALFVVGYLKEKGTDIRCELASKPLVLRWCVYLALVFATLIFGLYGGDYSNAGMIYGEF